MNGAASGHYFENFIVSELVKNFSYSGTKANITYYRDANAKEIDLFPEENNLIHPLEIKRSANPDIREVKKFSVLDKTSVQRGNRLEYAGKNYTWSRAKKDASGGDKTIIAPRDILRVSQELVNDVNTNMWPLFSYQYAVHL